MTKTTEKFEELYGKLNAEQKEAVDTIEGPVMVVAGPGTGKTTVLVLRIAKILLEVDANPENILALTFTRAASFEMRQRLARLIGPPAYRVGIFTFHEFCNTVIQEFPEYFPEIIGAEHITQAEQIQIIRGIISKEKFQYLKPFGDQFYYVRPILSTIGELKREGIGPEEFSEAVDMQENREIKDSERQLAKNKELANVYAQYQEVLGESKQYDYDDMVLQVARKLSGNEDFLRTLQERYLYLLADEHQDVNNAQNKVLELLGSYFDQPNLFIVGDEKQAIFRFQGASLENFLYFQRRYPNVKLIRLKQNYRSTQFILDAASYMMGEDQNTLSAVGGGEGEKVRVYAFSSTDGELEFIAQTIKRQVESGVDAREIAILYRDNRDAPPLVLALRKHSIPFIIESDQDVLQDEDIQKLLLLMRTLCTFGQDELLARALHIDFLGVEPLAIYELMERREKTGESLYRLLKEAEPELYRKLSDWARKSRNEDLVQLAERIIRESGFLPHVLKKPNSFEKMEKVRRLFQEIKNLVASHEEYLLEDFLLYLDVLRENRLSMEKKMDRLEFEGVRLMTAHKAKGREFSYVYIANAYDGHWGNRRIRRNFALPENLLLSFREGGDEEERKLFYVALTRARKQLVITYAKEGGNGKANLPCRFLEEIAPALKEEVPTKELEKHIAEHAEQLFAAPVISKEPNVQEKRLIQRLFKERGFSATSLNNYVTCPWKYFYLNLIRIPGVQSRQQRYGVAVHEALRNLFHALSKKKKADKEFLLSHFERALQRTTGKREEFDELLERGKKSLMGYYDTYHNTWNTNVISELGMHIELPALDIPLIGRLDKVEILDDKVSVVVVDYKTGKPKSRNEIEGKTKKSKGDYKRQLVFYQMLANRFWRDSKPAYQMIAAELDYVEPNERGKYKKERFEITQKEVENLEDIIGKAAKEISNLEFWSKTCGDKDCEFCSLRAMIR